MEENTSNDRGGTFRPVSAKKNASDGRDAVPLSRALFSSSLLEQESAVKTVAEKYIGYADTHGMNRKKAFDKFIREVKLIKYQAGVPKSKLIELRRRWRRWHREVSATIPLPIRDGSRVRRTGFTGAAALHESADNAAHLLTSSGLTRALLQRCDKR